MNARTTHTPPPFWYFPVDTPGFVMRCAFNPAENIYNKDCEVIPLPEAPSHIAAAIHWSVELAKQPTQKPTPKP